MKTGGTMENIGRLLKNTRTGLNKSLDEIYAQTRITVEHLRYLEENNFDFLPATYIKSFLKTYAAALGLNREEVLRTYSQNQQEQKAEKDKEARIQEERLQAASPHGRLLEWGLTVGALLLVIFITVVYVRYRSETYARPLENRNGHSRSLNFNAGNPAVISSSTPTGVTTKTFQLKIAGLENLAIQLDVTGVHSAKLPTPQKLNTATITAVERFDIVIDEAQGLNLKFDDMEMTDLGISGGQMRLTIVRSRRSR
jgi:cytoskeletal protein RodZ